MTEEQKNLLKKEISKALMHLSHTINVHLDEVIEVVREMYADDYVICTWPDVQELMELDGFRENSVLMNEPWANDLYGSQTYLVKRKWLLLS